MRQRNRAIITDIAERGLDPKKSYSKIDKTGKLTEDIKQKKDSNLDSNPTVFASIKSDENNILELQSIVIENEISEVSTSSLENKEETKVEVLEKEKITKQLPKKQKKEKKN